LPFTYPKYNISQNVIGLKLSEAVKKKITTKFLQIYFQTNVGKKQLERESSFGVQPKITLDAIRNILIPIFSNSKQKLIIDKYQSASDRKQQKEFEANELLNSIDTYLLNELGLELPKQSNDLRERLFISNYSELTNSRFDPISIRNYKNIRSQNPKYPLLTFKELFIKNPQYGANEEAIDGNSEKDVRYIRITDIDEWGNLRTDTWKTAANVHPNYLLKDNDILIARTGATVGKAFIYKEHNCKAIFAGYMIRFFLNPKKANADFVFHYLNSGFYKYWISTIQRPSAQPNINSEEYKSLPIPLPPLEKQNEISAKILLIRNQASKMFLEASEILETAKGEVEEMILG